MSAAELASPRSPVWNGGMAQTFPSLRCAVFALAVLLVLTTPVLAQMPKAPAPQAAPVAPPEAEPPPEEIANDSPAASVRAFLEAANRSRWDEAGRYLSLTAANASRRRELAERLKGVLDSRRLIDVDTLSGASAGKLDDGLPPQVEQVAVLAIDGEDQPLRLRRTSDKVGTYWAFSPMTVSHIDDWYSELPDRWIRSLLTGGRTNFLLSAGPLGLLWWQWLALPILAGLSWVAARLLRVSGPLIGIITARTTNPWVDQLAASLGRPLTLAFSLMVFGLGCSAMQFSASALGWVGALVRSGLVFALFWALWRTIAVFAALTLTRPWARTNPATLSLLTVGSNILRGAVVALGVLAMVAALGYPVGTVLAGLGIGGLALAFGAQKTVENVFGSMALAVDQPLRVGDLVKVEDFVGTVEDIGLRSTRFRTLDRTVVSIPNGKLADQRLESFQLRDRMRLATTVGLTYATTRQQMQAVLAGFERVLRSHPRIWADTVIVKFEAFGSSSLDIEVMAWFEVTTWTAFEECRQDVLLEFMQVVEEAGSSFAFPTRTIHLVQDQPSRSPVDPRPA